MKSTFNPRHYGGSSYSGTIRDRVVYDGENFREYECLWEVSGYYIPAKMYLRNGDPGWPEEGEDETELVEINDWPADRYLKRLKFWNPAAAKFLEEVNPDLDKLDKDVSCPALRCRRCPGISDCPI